MRVCSVSKEKYLNFILFSLVFTFFLSLSSAQSDSTIQTLGTFKVGSCVKLTQICGNCTFNNISSVTNPLSTIVISQTVMTKSGTEYNATFCATAPQGNYIVRGFGNPNGVVTSWIYDFNVTPSGFNNLLGLFIIVTGAIYFIGFFGFFGRNEWIAVLGGFAMISLGLFTLLNGIDIYRGYITEAFSFITLGIGAIFAIIASVEIVQENLLN